MTTDAKLFFEAFLSAGMACLALGLWIRRKEIATRKWPQTVGTIVTSRTEIHRGSNGIAEALPIVEYEFEYDGHSIKSPHWRIANYSSGRPESAQAVTSRYEVGMPVTVYVNRDKPAASVLEHGTTALSWIPIAFGIAFILLSLLPLIRQ